MRVFGEKPVTRVDRLHVAHFGGADDAVDLEVAFLAGSVADADSLVSQLNVERVGVRLRIDSQRADTQLTARTNDAHGDFTAIGYQDFVEHSGLCFQGLSCAAASAYLTRTANCFWPNSTGLAFSARISVMTPLTSALISFITFIASIMQTTVSGSTS